MQSAIKMILIVPISIPSGNLLVPNNVVPVLREVCHPEGMFAALIREVSLCIQRRAIISVYLGI